MPNPNPNPNPNQAAPTTPRASSVSTTPSNLLFAASVLTSPLLCRPPPPVRPLHEVVPQLGSGPGPVRRAALKPNASPRLSSPPPLVLRSFGPDAIPGDARWRRGESVSLKTARDTCDPCTQICTRPLSRHHETTNPILYPTQDGAPRARAVRRHLKPQSQPPPSLTLFLVRSTGTPRWSTRRAKRLLDEHQRQAARPRSLANPSRHWRHIGESVACVCVCGKFARASAGENRVSFKNVTSQLTSIMPG